MQQVAGPFRGRAKTEQLFGIGVGVFAWIRISLKKGGPRILRAGVAPKLNNCSLSYNPEADILYLPRGYTLNIFFLFVVDQGRNDCYI